MGREGGSPTPHTQAPSPEGDRGLQGGRGRTSWNKSRPGAQERLPKMSLSRLVTPDKKFLPLGSSLGICMCVFSFGGFRSNFILFSCDVGIPFSHFKQT